MYTHEIIETIENGNGILTQEQYMDICNNSPQITNIYVDPEHCTEFNCFAIKCDDFEEEIKFKVVA